MATRDRTSEFVDLRSRYARPRASSPGSGSDSLLSSPGSTTNWTHARDQLPPLWVDLVDQVDADVLGIKQQMAALGKLHASRVSSVFSDDLGARDREIEQATAAITAKFRHAEKLLKRVGKVEEGSTDEEVKIRKNIQSSNAKKMQALSVEFRMQQKEYLSSVSKQKSGNDAAFGVDLSSPTSLAGGAQFNDQQMAVVDDLEGIVQERDEEIMRIAQSIEELSQIFKELAVLVIDQGTILDRIDFNMEQVVEHTREGIKQLEKAEQHQKSARPIKCIACLLLLIAVMLTILILKHRR